MEASARIIISKMKRGEIGHTLAGLECPVGMIF
jgi:hypothetical protein